MYKTLIEVLQGTRDMDSACSELNKTWEGWYGGILTR